VIYLLMALGGLAQIWAWRLVAVGYLSIWAASVPALAVCGAAALVSGEVPLSPNVSVPTAVAGGLGAGLVLYAATRGFYAVAGTSPYFRRAAQEIYQEQGSLSTLVAFVLSLGLAVPGEELFWRGLFQGQATHVFGAMNGALLTWISYIVVNAASGMPALVMGAIVGGAAWGALAWWAHGVLAALVCHAVWTGLMLVRPPVLRRVGLHV
jgi:membrane protease YdiL (CAAX protease family)